MDDHALAVLVHYYRWLCWLLGKAIGPLLDTLLSDTTPSNELKWSVTLLTFLLIVHCLLCYSTVSSIHSKAATGMFYLLTAYLC